MLSGVKIRNLRGAGEWFLNMLSRLVVFLVVMTAVSRAAPQTNGRGGTLYLNDADSYVGKAPEIPKTAGGSASRPTPTPTPQTTSAQTPSRTSVEAPDDETTPHRDFPPAVIHRSTLTVGQQNPVPARYAPPQVIGNSALTVVPATPVSFGTIQTGITTSTDGAGNVSVRDTELSGFVNYGNPIRAVAPVYNQQGQQTGTQVMTVSSNPIIVPVTTTIEMR
jgi:hypothetical protein